MLVSAASGVVGIESCSSLSSSSSSELLLLMSRFFVMDEDGNEEDERDGEDSTQCVTQNRLRYGEPKMTVPK